MLDPDIARPEFKANPWPFYTRLRAGFPVHRVTLSDKRIAWLVTRYDDVFSVLRDERIAKDRFRALTPDQMAKQPWIPKLFMPLVHNMLDQDPPDHTRLRGLVHKAFTPRLVEAMRERIQALTNELLDAVVHRRRMELVRDYALPLPSTIIAQMLGIPPRDRHKFHRWSSSLVSIDMSKWGLLKGIPPLAAFLRYIRKLVKSRSAHPGDDLVSALLEAREAGEQLSEDEMVAMIFLLLIAGHETTVNLIGNGTLALLEHPDQLEKLKNDPTLIKSAVEELLRYDGPLETATERYTKEDVTVAGVTIPQGELVFAVLASANHDERQFKNPATLDLGREDNKHVAFGFGAHYCLGASLARLEAQIAFQTLLRRCPDLQLVVPRDRLRWKRGHVLRGLRALPVAFATLK